MVGKQRQYVIVHPRQKHSLARDTIDFVISQFSDKLRDGDLVTFLAAVHRIDASLPSRHDNEDQSANGKWYPAAFDDLGQVSYEKRSIDALEE